MKRRGSVGLSDVLGQYLKTIKIDERLLAARIMEEWGGIVSSVVEDANRARLLVSQTQGMYIKEKTLYVTMTSAGAMASLGEVRGSLLLAVRAKFGLSGEHLAGMYIG